MGYWGYEPFQNDSILNAIGGFTDPKDISKELVKLCDDKNEWCCTEQGDLPSYEVIGIILQIFYKNKGYSIADSKKIEKIISIVRQRNFTDGNVFFIYKSLHESMETLLSAATLETKDLKKLLIKAVNNTTEIIEKLEDGELERKNCIRKIYNEAYSLVSNNFVDVTNRISLTADELKMLIYICMNEEAPELEVKPSYNANIIECTCIKKFRNNKNVIIGYRLVDNYGKEIDVTSENLKQAIINNQVIVKNMTLAKDGRLFTKNN